MTPEQLETEFDGCLDLARFMLRNLGLDDDVSYRFSKWDENDRGKYIGELEEWDRVQNLMRGILVRSGIDFEEADGEAAFYGPKLDIQIRNVFGKEDTLITIQIDFQLAEKFGMKYSDADGELRYPYIIHRTSVGCYERTIALLLEKHKGVLPLWLAPEQVRILAVADRHNEAVEKFAARFRAAGLRVKTDRATRKSDVKSRRPVEKAVYHCR